MEPQKIQMPDMPDAKKEDTTPVLTPDQLAQKMKLSITEEKQMLPLDNYKWMAELYTSNPFRLIFKIQDEPECLNQQWHFIPFTITDADKEDIEYDSDYSQQEVAQIKKATTYFQFFCIDNPKALKKLTKKIRKYFPMATVNWVPFSSNEYQKP